MFVAEQLLKDEDLSYDEIRSGLIGGGGDGGIDALYLFANGELLQEDTDLTRFKRGFDLEVVIIQSKAVSGFSETAIDKLISSTADLFDLGRPPPVA